MVRLSAGSGRPSLVQPPESADPARTQGPSETAVVGERADHAALARSVFDGEYIDSWGALEHREQFVAPANAPMPAPPEAAPLLRVASETTPLSMPSEAFPLRVLSRADQLLGLFEMVPIPEPDSWAMPIAGLLGIYAVVRRRTISS